MKCKCGKTLFTFTEQFSGVCNHCYYNVDAILSDMKSRVRYPTMTDDKMLDIMIYSDKPTQVMSFWLKRV